MKNTLTGINTTGQRMFLESKIFRSTTAQILVWIWISFNTLPASARSPDRVSVNIYGDGNPGNGAEDSREQLRPIHPGEQRISAGTIKCAGKIRGSAMVINTRVFAPVLKGAMLVTAAHVFYDLQKKRRFRRCEFQYPARGRLDGYRVRIRPDHVKMGRFDPMQTTTGLKFGEGDWAFVYIAEPWKSFRPDEGFNLRRFSNIEMESLQQSGGDIRIIAYDSSARAMSESSSCMVFESNSDDLGGGTWQGQLLDDCDSADGASGGGIVARVDQEQYVIGIRSGSHWSEKMYPAGEFPTGPPEGAVWNRQTNTNFARAIDDHVLNELEKFVTSLKKNRAFF